MENRRGGRQRRGRRLAGGTTYCKVRARNGAPGKFSARISARPSRAARALRRRRAEPLEATGGALMPHDGVPAAAAARRLSGRRVPRAAGTDGDGAERPGRVGDAGGADGGDERRREGAPPRCGVRVPHDCAQRGRRGAAVGELRDPPHAVDAPRPAGAAKRRADVVGVVHALLVGHCGRVPPGRALARRIPPRHRRRGGGGGGDGRRELAASVAGGELDAFPVRPPPSCGFRLQRSG